MAEQLDVPADSAVHRYLDALVDRARTTLPDNLVGVYVTGSLATGGYLQDLSDIDVMLVVDASLDHATKAAVIDRLRNSALPCPTRGLELVIYRREVVAIGRTDPAFELELNDGPRMAFRSTSTPSDRPPEDGTFWYALDRDIVRQRGIALLGPPSADVFGALSEPELAAVIDEADRWHTEHAPGTENAARNARRGRIRIETGKWLSKRSPQVSD
ncbi:nucleotidyltransferase domain-containing protein [Antrihabitans cavernicola]|uniref:Nucleotidyltransferase domain-containing protein n=1 Tax=Antrihabitans cavernicola TaxID=2495913 RepID=A0A5A7SHK0_9NOCA|nr:nucleotidyltransferase domain-containing protein [Spelaeibacter cavernicola]KAA0024207.1 nucleotidyltransferase domain-containing protein [Spelaeibacter cavernicola]